MRLALGLLFCGPATLLIYVATADPYAISVAIRIGLLLLAVFPMLAGLFLGSARIEKRFDRARRTTTQSISFLGFDFDLEATLPARGTVTLTSQWDEGPYWTFRTTADGIEGATFSNCADYSAATQFGQELADFLGWKFCDLSDHNSRGNVAP